MNKIYNIFNMNEFNDISNIIKDINNEYLTNPKSNWSKIKQSL